MIRRIFKSHWLSLSVGIILLVASVGEGVAAFRDDLSMHWDTHHTLCIYSIWHILRAVAAILDSIGDVVK